MDGRNRPCGRVVPDDGVLALRAVLVPEGEAARAEAAGQQAEHVRRVRAVLGVNEDVAVQNGAAVADQDDVIVDEGERPAASMLQVRLAPQPRATA